MVTTTETKIPEKWANPEVLKWARKRMGLEPQGVEKLALIRAEDIIQWEKGESAPTLANLEGLAEIYNCPVGYFFLDSPPIERTPLDLRGLRPDKSANLSYESHSQLEEFLRLTDYVSELAERTGKTGYTYINQTSLREPAESLAERERKSFGFTPEIRNKWNSPEDAFQFWKEAAEKRGAYVITLKLNGEEIRGASRWDANQPPCILINHQDGEAATGRIFTLLHEWAHLLIKHTGIVCDFQGQKKAFNIESYANQFAAKVLAPKQELIDVLKKENLFAFRDHWGDPTIERIRNQFKVSKDVVAILLEEIDLAPQGFYRNKRAAWDRRRIFFKNAGRTHPGQTKAMRKLKEIGQPFADLISEAWGRGVISKLEMAEILDMKVEQAEEFALRPRK